MSDREKQIQEVYKKLVEEGTEPNIAKEAAIFGVLTYPLIKSVFERILDTK